MVTKRRRAERASKRPQRSHARRLRRERTNAERALWWCVRNRTLDGFKFRRQYPVGPYIADFACLDAKLIVELDGSGHDAQRAYDAKRDAFLRAEGFRVLRIPNHDVIAHRQGAVDTIWRALQERECPTTPSP
ncbi:MAG TPA: DUF559 domain-containing protein [Rhizomicrobium sp.]